MRLLIRFFVTMLWALLTMPALATSITTYQIGNSLTWDSQPLGIAAIADDFGFDHTVGYHIRCGYSLQRILDDPTSTCVNPVPEFGTFGSALPGHKWDAITLQPHPNVAEPPGQEHLPASTLLSDVTSISTLINLAQTNIANADTTFYIYSAWPRISNFETDWTSSVADEDTTETIYAREYFDLLFNRVTAATSAKIAVIPVGEVLYELQQRIEAGQVPGFTTLNQLYRDDIHLTFDVGRYVAGITTFATMYGIDPAGSTKPNGFYGSDSAFSPELYEAVHAAVWDVISANPFANPLFSPGDFSRDKTIDAADLAIFESAFGTNSAGDGDRDGDTDGADFLLWQRGFEGSVLPISSPAVTVPEPNSLLMLFTYAVVVGGWRSGRRRNARLHSLSIFSLNAVQ